MVLGLVNQVDQVQEVKRIRMHGPMMKVKQVHLVLMHMIKGIYVLGSCMSPKTKSQIIGRWGNTQIHINAFNLRKSNTSLINTYQGRFFGQVKINLEIPIKAVQDQLQCDLLLQLSISKAFRAKAKYEKEVEGDHTLQYAMLRDYVVELQSTNLNTTVKITFEMNWSFFTYKGV